jgi:hypothetical protein
MRRKAFGAAERDLESAGLLAELRSIDASAR